MSTAKKSHCLRGHERTAETVLVERGYSVILSAHPLGSGWAIDVSNGATIDFSREQLTIAAVIATGVMTLLECI